MNVFDLAVNKTKLKKVSSTGGGEWQGPCPECGGTDRFHVWPNKNDGQGAYWCRGCDKSGDAIQYLRDFEGKTFQEACAYLNITMEEREYKPQPKPEKPQFQPATHEKPADLWQEKAEKFVAWAQENLKNNPEIMKWLADRGINAAAVEKYRLGWNPGENGRDIYRPRKSWGLPVEIKQDTGKPKKLWIPIGLVIPYFAITPIAREAKQSLNSSPLRGEDKGEGEFPCPPLAEVAQSAGGGCILRIRIRRPEGEPRYYVIPGSSSAIMVLGADRKAFIITESALDAIACYEAQDQAGAIPLDTSHAKPDAPAFELLKNAVQILNALDYDQAGASAMRWWEEQFPYNCQRWPVPVGKDPGEAYELGTDLAVWIKAGLPPSMTIGCPPRAEVARSVGDGTYDSSPLRGEDKGEGENNNVNPVEAGIQDFLSAPVAELYRLLKNNPAVKIINKPESLTVLRNGKYVGGRINDLIFKEKDVMEYILQHPDEEINYQNFVKERV